MQTSRSLCVAVVAHDAGVRDSLATLLGAADCLAVPFESGSAFLAAPMARFADHLVLHEDIADISPFELIRQLRVMDSPANVLLITGQTSPELLRRAKAAGIAEVFEAPMIARGIVDFLSASRGARAWKAH